MRGGRGDRGCLCRPLPPPSGISIASQAEAEEALESVESEAFSLIESHASVTRKALQSRKDSGAAEPQPPPPSPAPPRGPCLSSSPSPTHDRGLGGSQGAQRSHPVPRGWCRAITPGDRLEHFGRCIWYFVVLVFILGMFFPLWSSPRRGCLPPSKRWVCIASR